MGLLLDLLQSQCKWLPDKGEPGYLVTKCYKPDTTQRQLNSHIIPVTSTMLVNLILMVHIVYLNIFRPKNYINQI